MTKEEYLRDRSNLWRITLDEYYNKSGFNYIILCGGNEPLCWDNGFPIVYGGKEDYEGDTWESDIVITEKEYIDSL